MFITIRCTPFQSPTATKVIMDGKHVFSIVIFIWSSPLTPVAPPASASRQCKPVTKLLSPQRLSSQILFVPVSSLTRPCSHSKCKTISPCHVLGCIKVLVELSSLQQTLSFLTSTYQLWFLRFSPLRHPSSYSKRCKTISLWFHKTLVEWHFSKQFHFQRSTYNFDFNLTLFVICPA